MLSQLKSANVTLSELSHQHSELNSLHTTKFTLEECQYNYEGTLVEMNSDFHQKILNSYVLDIKWSSLLARLSEETEDLPYKVNNDLLYIMDQTQK